MIRQVLIVGCGYIGEQVALKELGMGAAVSAIVKSVSSAENLISKGIVAKTVDLDDDKGSLDVVLSNYDVVYYFTPPQVNGSVDLRIQKFFKLIGEKVIAKRLVLMSTTGVYGDCAGDWVDESGKLRPVVARAHRRLSAEKQCVAWSKRMNTSLIILRTAGIYGPGKLPLQRLRRGDPVLAVEESPWSNRIYAKDLIEICIRAAQSDVEGVLNAADGNPSTMTDYFFKIADHAGINRPAEISMEEASQQLAQGILSYLKESRRVGNYRLIEALGTDCVRFPTLDQGLADIKLSEA